MQYKVKDDDKLLKKNKGEMYKKLKNHNYVDTVNFYTFLRNQTIENYKTNELPQKEEHHKDIRMLNKQPQHLKQSSGNPIEDEILEKQQKKKQYEKFMNNEKQYFDVLEELNQKGYKDFIDNAQIRQKYYFDNIVKPEKQFITPKDLQIKHDDDDLVKFQNKQINMNHITSKINELENFSNNLNDILQDIKQTKENEQQLFDNKNYLEKQFYKLVRLGDLEKVEECIKIDSDLVKTKDVKGRSALQLAAQRGYKDLVEYLLQFKPSINDQENIVSESIKSAKKNNFNDVVQLLKNYEKQVLEKMK